MTISAFQHSQLGDTKDDEGNALPKLRLAVARTDVAEWCAHLSLAPEMMEMLENANQTDDAVQAKEKAVDKVVFVALDRSGSMSGSPFSVAKEAVHKLIVSLRDAGVASIQFFPFDHTAPHHSCGRKEMDDATFNHLMSKLSIGGGTSFATLFSEITIRYTELASTAPQVDVLVFSDGQDNRASAEAGFKQLAEVIRSSGQVHLDTHCIGFSSGHDALLLGNLSQVGDSGSFQYVAQAADIDAAIASLTDTLTIRRFSCKLITGAEEGKSYDFRLDVDDTATLFLPDNAGLTSASIVFETDDGTGVRVDGIAAQDVSGGEGAAPTDPVYFHINLEAINAKLRNTLSVMTKTTATDELAKEWRAVLDKALQRLDTIQGQTGKLPRYARKTYLGRCMMLRKLATELSGHLAQAKRELISNVNIAKWQSMASRSALKQRDRKAIDKRSEQNVKILERQEKDLVDMAKKLKDSGSAEEERMRQELTATVNTISPDLFRGLRCVFTFADPIDAMLDADCLCIALDIARSPAAIHDPCQLEIRAVHPSYLTAASYLDAVDAALQLKDETSVHGGFDPSIADACVLRGTANESITGVLPLYLNAQHWRFAEKRARPAMGFMCTLDPLGAVSRQLERVAFLVLARIVQDAQTHGWTDFRRVQFQLVFDTCYAIYDDDKRKELRDEVLDTVHGGDDGLGGYANNPVKRTVDVVPRETILLGYILCALRRGDLAASDVAGLANPMAEETLRRLMQYNQSLLRPAHRFDSPLTPQSITDVVAVRQSEWVETPVDEWWKQYNTNKSDSKTNYASMFRSAATAATTTAAAKVAGSDKKKPAPADAAPESAATLPPLVMKKEDLQFTAGCKGFVAYVRQQCGPHLSYVLQYLDDIVKYATTGEFVATASAAGDGPSRADQFFDQFSAAQLLAILVQCYQHKENAARREAVADGSYVDFMTPAGGDDGDQLVTRHFLRQLEVYVNAERTARVSRHFANAADTTSSALGFAFDMATDADECAGILKYAVCFRSVPAFHYCYSQLQGEFANRPNRVAKPAAKPAPSSAAATELARQKLLMLITGQYNGVALFSDKYTKPRDTTAWSLSRKNLCKLWRAYRHYPFDQDFWVQLAPHHKEGIEKWYITLAKAD
ncbi:hypothetical protein RI367_004363 [Sorochytrium milnesiophthora]